MTNTNPEATETKLPAQTVYEVQTQTFANGWVNTWMYEDANSNMRPETFATEEAAQAALDDYLQELAEDVALGNITDYEREDFRIQPVFPTATAEGGTA